MNKLTSLLIRDIQIDLIMDNPNPVVVLFNDIWSGLTVIKVDAHDLNGNEFIYYDKDSEAIFYRDDDSDVFWCDYVKYWEVFKTRLNISTDDLSLITHIMVEQKIAGTINKKIAIPSPSYLSISRTLNEILEKL